VTNATAFEPIELLRVLCRHGVAFVAIGGFAAEVQGVSWSTLDLDIVIEDREENYTALAAALVDVDAWCLVPLGSIQRIRPDLELLRALTGTLMLRTRCGRLDVMKGSDSGAGGDNYATLARDALETNLGGSTFLVAGLSAILRMKRAANRPKDRKVLSMIEAAIEAKNGSSRQ